MYSYEYTFSSCWWSFLCEKFEWISMRFGLFGWYPFHCWWNYYVGFALLKAYWLVLVSMNFQIRVMCRNSFGLNCNYEYTFKVSMYSYEYTFHLVWCWLLGNILGYKGKTCILFIIDESLIMTFKAYKFVFDVDKRTN